MKNAPTILRIRATKPTFPYGKDDLDPNMVRLPGAPAKARCVVRGCTEILLVPGRRDPGELCPIHGIRVHASGTYSFHNPRRNLIVSPETFTSGILHNPFKFECHRFGFEKSEDALTWNVFRALQEAGCLGEFARWITGDSVKLEPSLYLWGLRIADDGFDPWPLLVAARERFEQRLPEGRPFTEPDIALFLPGRYLILIEAKFTSPNTFYAAEPRRDQQWLSLDQFRERYWDDSLRIIDRDVADRADRIYQQLWRNVVFAEWMAWEDHPRTRAFHVNLVRQGYEVESAQEFAGLVREDYRDRFRQITWEQIHQHFAASPALAAMLRYMEEKTAGLMPAFRL